MIDVVVPIHRLEDLIIDGRRYQVPPGVLAHYKMITTTLANLARVCETQRSRIAELEAPKPPTFRWTPALKEAVVWRARIGEAERRAVLLAFGISAEELNGWDHALKTRGPEGLKVTALQRVGRGGR